MKTGGKILITGGSGLIGSHLIPMLLERKYEVSVLSRTPGKIPGAQVYPWDPEKEEIDPQSVSNVKAVVHLAGAGIGDKRWTQKRKQEILDSRVKPIHLLAREMKRSGSWPETFVSASGISLYDQQDFVTRHTESSPPDKSFLAEVVKEWEKAADIFSSGGSRTVKLRKGIVLDEKSGALPKMALPVKMGVGSALGSGRQWISWIHIQDICRLYCEAIENASYHGAYNAVAPDSVTNQHFMSVLSKVLKRPYWPVKVPAFVLRVVLGEMASVVVEGALCANERLHGEHGFQFLYPDLDNAFRNLYR